MGYCAQTKGYKVFDIATQKITTSRDVIFHEKHFPFHLSHTSDTTAYPTQIYLPSVTSLNFTNDHADNNVSADNSEFPESGVHTASIHDPILTDLSSNVSSSVSDQIPRHSSRTHKAPSYLNDYQCHNVSQTTSHWCNLVQFLALSPKHQCHISKICDIHEPRNYKDPLKIHYGLKLWIRKLRHFMRIIHGIW